MGNATSWFSPNSSKKDGTTLVELEIGHISDAHDIIGLQPEDFTPIVLIPRSAATRVCGLPCCYTSIPAGFNAMVSRWGSMIDGKDNEDDGSWAPGFHCFYPWYRVDRLVSKQLIIFDTPVKDCKTKDDITVHIDVLIVFEIAQASDFVFGLGPEKLDDLLRASQEEVLRQIAGETLVENIYDLHGANTEKWVAEMNTQFSRFGVNIKHFTVTNVKIPLDMAQDFEDKTLYESKTIEKAMQQDSDRLKLSNDEEQQKLREECDNSRMAEEERTVTTRAQLSKEVREVIACTEKEVLLAEAQRDADVEDVTVSADLEIAKIKAEIHRLKRETEANIEKEVGKLEAEAEAYESQKRASAKMQASAKTSQGKKTLAEAEGAAEESFAARRAQEQELARIGILSRLADNSHIRVVTSLENNTGLAPDNSLVAQIAQQGMEALRMKLAEATSTSVGKLNMGKVVSGGLVRPVPQMTM